MQAQVYWIEGPWPGRLAILPRPRGGDWLENEVLAWRTAGIDAVVSTLTGQEIAELDLSAEAALSRANGVDFIAFPLPDRGLPPSVAATVALARKMEEKLANGRNVAVHCRQGVGRSSLFAACVLVVGNVEPETAWARIQSARGCVVPDTPEQRAWVVRLAGALKKYAPPQL